MNILHLKYAIEVNKTNSISKAAENLYMGQPNLSRAVKELEENIGITIFKRTSKGIFPTPDGEEFLHYANRIISQIEEVEAMYKEGKAQKVRFSVCVPRASYISYAIAKFIKNMNICVPAEFSYRETSSSHTINSVVRGDSNLGIIRYLNTYDKYFKGLFLEKKLTSEVICDFSYLLLVSKNSSLAEKKNINIHDLKDYIEITHADSYVPSVPIPEIKKNELSEQVDKRILIFERATQFVLLETVPSTFMWVSPTPKPLLEKYNLIQIKCEANDKIYRDVVIRRKNHKLSDFDNAFIKEVNSAISILI